MKEFLIILKGKSGARYCLQFECDTNEDAEAMFGDTGLRGRVDGKLIESITFDGNEYTVVN